MKESNKAHIHGVPGEHARAVGVMRAVWPLLCALFVCGFFSGALFSRVGPGLAGLGFLVAGLFLLWAARDGMKSIDAYFKGARGEEHVAVQLGTLPNAFHVFHDCVFAGCGVDHVVVGPSGVFSVETKCWAGKVTCVQGDMRVNGMSPSRPPLAQARRASQEVSRYLLEKMGTPRPCTPVLCFASDTFETDVSRVEDVIVCNAAVLPDLIVANGGHLMASEIEQIVKMMEP